MKIHFHWLKGIIIVMISFILFIIYTAFFHIKISSELISDHYYEEEIEYQEIFNEKKNMFFFTNLNIQVLPIGIKLYFLNGRNISGTLNLLRLSNKHLDVARVIQLDITGKKVIPVYTLKYGTYLLRIRWKHSNKIYFIEQNIQWNI